MSVGLAGADLVAWWVSPAWAASGPAGPLRGARSRRLIIDVTRPPFRARGDGQADDAPAIQAALDEAAAGGGGVVYLPAGAYQLGSIQQQAGVRNYILNYHSGVSMLGAGCELTVLRAPAGMPDQTRIISANSADGKSRVIEAAFHDFTIDGNAASQPAARSSVGISNVYTTSIAHVRVRIVGVKGMADAEGTCFDSYASANNSYRDCEAIQRPGDSTGSGFSATRSAGITYEHCTSAGSAHWQGFTTYLSQVVDYVDCHGYLNGQRGLNCESSTDVRYVNCRAGGEAIGNRGDGIYVFKSKNVDLIDCTSQANQSGVVNIGSNVRILRGQFMANSEAGLAFGSMADWENSSIDKASVLTDNGRGAVAIAGLPTA
jgi:pectate lyase-like protein